MVIGRLIAGREGDFWGYGEFNFELFDLRLSYVQALASEDCGKIADGVHLSTAMEYAAMYEVQRARPKVLQRPGLDATFRLAGRGVARQPEGTIITGPYRPPRAQI